MPRLILIDEAFALSVHNHNNAACPIVVREDKILGIIPWDVSSFETTEPKEYVGGTFTGYLLMIEGYYNSYNSDSNIEKYEIKNSQYKEIRRQIMSKPLWYKTQGDF